MGVRIRNEHYSLSGVQYRVEIVDSDWAGAVSTFEDDGFKISWDDESDNFLEPIKASSCRYTMFDDGGGTFSAFKSDLASAQENEFQLAIYKYSGSWQLYWVGVIMPDMVQWDNDNEPRRFEIIAKDGLNRIKTIVFDNIDSSPFTTSAQTFMYIIGKILDKNGLASFHTGDYIKVSQDWYETQMSSTNPQRVLENVRIWGEMLRKDIDDTEAKKTDVDPMYCGEVLENLLKLFACRILYSDGCYHIQQIKNFNASTYNEADYDNTSTYVTVNSSVSNRSTVDGSALRIMGGGMFGYHAAYKRAKLTARGYLDIRGAYIEKIEVNKSDTSNTETLQLGTIVGGVYATATKTTTGSTNTFRAVNAGTGGNSIALVFDGVDTTQTVVDDWNTANPTNTVYIESGAGSIVHAAGTTTLSGGDGDGNRYLEISFDVQNANNRRVKASNILTTVEVKLICGSYRIKNRGTGNNTFECDWSTTAADKWSYTVEGDNDQVNKVQIITPEIPFASEATCTCEITIKIEKKDGASWTSTAAGIWPQTNWDFYATLRRGRVIAWDKDVDTLSDAEVIINNPTNTENSLEIDLGKIIIGDNPLVQRTVSTKNSFEIKNSLGTWKRPNVWEAGYSTDYNLVTTMLMEYISLRKSPTAKYMGGFVGTYSAHKAISYDSAVWVMNQVELDSKTDEWNGSWFAISYSQTSVTQSEERLKPLTGVYGLPPIRVKEIPTKDLVPLPVNPKGKGVIYYEFGSGPYTSIDVDALDNNHFRSGDSMMVYHPVTRDLLHEWVVDADTTVSDTSITVVSDTPDSDIPTGAILEHNSKEVVESQNVRSDNFVYLGASWSKTVYITETAFTSSVYTLDGTEGITLVNISGGGLYYVELPPIADAVKNGCGLDLIVKHLDGAFEVRVPAGDTGVYIKTTQASTLTSLAVTGGASLRLVYDVANQHWQRISI